MLTCNNYFMAGAVAIVVQPATLPVLVLIVPIFYSTAGHIISQQWTLKKLAQGRQT
jgi:hypothetical protein